MQCCQGRVLKVNKHALFVTSYSCTAAKPWSQTLLLGHRRFLDGKHKFRKDGNSFNASAFSLSFSFCFSMYLLNTSSVLQLIKGMFVIAMVVDSSLGKSFFFFFTYILFKASKFCFLHIFN